MASLFPVLAFFSLFRINNVLGQQQFPAPPPPPPQPPFPVVPIVTVMVAEQQLATTSPAPINPANELVDQVETIEVSSNQLVVTTTREGPPDTARVAIEVVDIATGVAMPPLNLTGILLILTRGRYTINWLQPNKWYGLDFRAEQHYAGGTAVYTNEEHHLVKTQRADGTHEEGKPMVSVRVQRYGDGGRSLENLVLTMRWEQHPEERPNLDALANITLFCAEQIKYKQLRLSGREIDKSVEIRLDNQFEVHEARNGTARQMEAEIRPKNCPRICWNAELVADSRGRTFRRAATHQCEQIEPIRTDTWLRDFAGWELRAPGGDLVVYTNYSEPDEEESADAYVQLTAIAVPEAKKADNTTIRYKTFNTQHSEGIFVLDRLEPGHLYAVQYTYGKNSPFAYEESRRFMVDTGSGLDPVQIRFNLSAPESIQPGVTATATLDPRFKQYEVGVDMEPICEPDEASVHFWLDKDRNARDLHELHLLDALCTVSPQHSVCRAPGTAAGVRGCGMREGQLCYTANIVVHQKLFSAPRKCEELAKAVPPVPTTTSSTSSSSSTSNTTPKSTSSSSSATSQQKRAPAMVSAAGKKYNSSTDATKNGQKSQMDKFGQNSIIFVIVILMSFTM